MMDDGGNSGLRFWSEGFGVKGLEGKDCRGRVVQGWLVDYGYFWKDL